MRTLLTVLAMAACFFAGLTVGEQRAAAKPLTLGVEVTPPPFIPPRVPAVSRSETRKPLPRPQPPPGFTTWLHSATSRAVRRCESGMNYRIVDVNAGVAYYGAWQANEDFWRTYGGDPAFLGPAPFTAPRWMQDRVAWRGYQARGWQPWTCAR